MNNDFFININNLSVFDIKTAGLVGGGLLSVLVVGMHALRNRVSKQESFDRHNTHILFIDDKTPSVVKNIQDAGWVNTAYVRDIKNIHDDEVKRAQIIFVDYRGVGRTFSKKDEGFALVRELKKEYGVSKRVILYSGEADYTSEFMNGVRSADAHIPKDSQSEEFMSLIREQVGILNQLDK